MCQPGHQPAPPASAADAVADAVAAAKAALAFLASAETTSLPAVTAAECLRGLEQATAMHVAARARMLSGFAAQRGFEDDGQGSAGSWLRWQTRITRGAAAEAGAWARRLTAHPVVADALAAGDISASWAKAICGWTGRLPADKHADADAILLAAAAGGAELADLAGLAEEMHKRCTPPDGDGGFADRWLRLDLTLHGAGRLQGDLTPACAAALNAVLDALGKKAGPEDVRSKAQREHDALEEACRRLVGAGCLPERAGQPTQIQLHMTLDQLRGLDDAGDAEAAWAQAARAGRGPGAPPGAECDASIVPIVSGHVDPVLLDLLAAALRGEHASPPQGASLVPPGPRFPRPLRPVRWPARAPATAPAGSSPAGLSLAGWPASVDLPPSADPALAAAAVRARVLRHAADLLSGPAGLAAFLRTRLLEGAAGSVSLPLDAGKANEQIPCHLRRVVIARDRCCAFPGCSQPPAACQVHHIRPRREGGGTKLTNLILLCPFHHLIAVHRWGWRITLHPDGTVAAISPDGQRTLHSHGPPARAA